MMDTDRYEMLRNLSQAQLTAIDTLMEGSDVQAAAEAAGVHRVTISRWKNHHPEFQAELNRRREEQLTRRADRIRRMDEIALDHLQQRIESGDEAAIDSWIKARGLGKIDTSRIGPRDSGEIIAGAIDDRFEAESREAREEFGSILDTNSFGRDVDKDEVAETVKDELLQRSVGDDPGV